MDHDVHSPLWTISFQNRGNSIRQARFEDQSAPASIFSQARAHELVSFIEKLNSTLKEAADRYASERNPSPEMERQIRLIREQFNIVNQWIEQMRKQFPNP